MTEVAGRRGEDKEESESRKNRDGNINRNRSSEDG